MCRYDIPAGRNTGSVVERISTLKSWMLQPKVLARRRIVVHRTGDHLMSLGTTPSLTDRMMRAARLDVILYNEVEADLNATSQALTVVVITAIAAGIGTALGAALAGSP